MNLSRAVMLLAVLAPLTACRASRAYEPNPGPYDRIPALWEDDLVRARESFEEGDLAQCHATLLPLAEADPNVIPVRVFQQEVQLGLLGAGQEVAGLRVPPREARLHLADIYAQRADANPSATGYVLAARLDTDGDAALAHLEQAEALDPACVWVHYAKGWWLFSLRRFPEARESIEAVFELDGGHMSTMRLQASMFASAGDTLDAIEVLEKWLDRGEEDPLVDPRLRAEGQVDLAALLVLDDEAEAAIDLLASIRPELLPDPARARAELVRAAALEDLGLRTLALSAARRAKGADDDALLALVQQALLMQFEGNTTMERVFWVMVKDEAKARWEREPDETAGLGEDPSSLDFQAILVQLQANARIERIDADQRARGPQP
jgi:hypothetical protein